MANCTKAGNPEGNCHRRSPHSGGRAAKLLPDSPRPGAGRGPCGPRGPVRNNGGEVRHDGGTARGGGCPMTQSVAVRELGERDAKLRQADREGRALHPAAAHISKALSRRSCGRSSTSNCTARPPRPSTPRLLGSFADVLAGGRTARHASHGGAPAGMPQRATARGGAVAQQGAGAPGPGGKDRRRHRAHARKNPEAWATKRLSST